MFHLARLLEVRVERLRMVVPPVVAMVWRVAAAMRLQHVPALSCQDDSDVPMTIKPLGSDGPFVAEMAQVTRARIERTIGRIMVAFQPASFVVATAAVLVGVRASRVAAWTSACLAGLVVAVARSGLGLARAVIEAVVVESRAPMMRSCRTGPA